MYIYVASSIFPALPHSLTDLYYTFLKFCLVLFLRIPDKDILFSTKT